ncbi:hypothetical protein RJT34_18985 [Clitoria ternatea]|uniref:Uncharacterized protein n=1 Tax=Clitoria ternatea TaxID=43366 RepID=A0AAN9IQ69_CLITE
MLTLWAIFMDLREKEHSRKPATIPNFLIEPFFSLSCFSFFISPLPLTQERHHTTTNNFSSLTPPTRSLNSHSLYFAISFYPFPHPHAVVLYSREVVVPCLYATRC